MRLRDAFIINEGREDASHREIARNEHEKLISALPTAHVEVITGPTAELSSNEVAYFIPDVLDDVDTMVVFTTPSTERPKGTFLQADSTSGREKPIVAIYQNEHPKDLIKRKLLATRGGITDAGEKAEELLRKNFPIFVHEFMHGVDLLRAPGYKYPDVASQTGDTPEEKARKKQEYYNTELELNAFMQTAFAEVERLYQKNPAPWSINDHATFYDRVRRFVERNYPNFYKNMTPDNFKKFQKRVMQLWLDLRASAPTG
jgi:hypothetical protein